ncbi:MAG: hypothetical protein P4L53_18840 [Candidatus Obscuribacterales bacterium]|nr:hypothetical protein [Candidatus Obscuribacterales bacterium]
MMRSQNYKSALSSLVIIGAIFGGNASSVQATTISGHLEQISTATASGTTKYLGLSRTDSFPDAYEGQWQCETTVVDSAVGEVIPGVKTVSRVNFTKNASGAITSSWQQDGWAEGQSTVTAFSTNEAQLDRTSYYMVGSNAGLWAARARGQYTKVAADAIVAKSVVDQYMDGQYVGRYRTTSVMRRLRPEVDMAILKVREPNDNDGPAYLDPYGLK